MMPAQGAAPAAGAGVRTPLLVNWEARAWEQFRRGVPFEQVAADLQVRRGDAERGVQSARAAYAAERYHAGATYEQMLAELTALGATPDAAEVGALRGYTVFAADELRHGRPIADMPATGTWRIPAENGLVRYVFEELADGARYEDVVAAVTRMGVPLRDGTPRSLVNEEAQRVVAQAGGRAAGLRRDLRAQQAGEGRRIEGMASVIEGAILIVGGILASVLLSTFVAGGVIAIGALVVGAFYVAKGVVGLGLRNLLTNRRAAVLVAAALLALVAGVALVPWT